MVKVVLVGMVAVFVIFLLKAGKPEFAMAVSLGTCILLLLYAVGTLSGILPPRTAGILTDIFPR